MKQPKKTAKADKERIEFQADAMLKSELIDVARKQDRQMSDMARVFIREGINRFKAASASSNEHGEHTATNQTAVA